MTKIKISPDEIKQLYEEYNFQFDEMLDYDDETLKIFKRFSNLSAPDKIILALYSHYQSQRKVASLLNVSRTTVISTLNKIRKQILYD